MIWEIIAVLWRYSALFRRISARPLGVLALVIPVGLLGLWGAPDAHACTVTLDPFTYADGTDLNGVGGGFSGSGGFFTTDWYNDGATPAESFTIQNGQAVVGNTGGQDVTISRGVDLSGVTFGCPSTDPTCASSSAISSPGTNYFYGQLTQVVDNHAAYEFSIQFSDDFGLTAAVGVINDGTGDPLAPQGHNDYFFADLGTSRVISSVAADPNTPNYVYAALTFDSGSLDEERLRVWVNSDFSDIMNGTSPDIDMSFDLDSIAGASGRSSLGNTMSMTANTQEDGSFKAFDDFMIAQDLELIGVPRIDIGSTSDLQVAFESWDVGATGSPSFLTSFDLENYAPSIDSRIATLSLEANDAVNLTPFSQTFTTEGLADDLRKDGVSAAGGYVLRFEGLLDDEHLVKTFHHHSTSGGSVDVYRSSDNGVTYDYYGTFIQATGGDAATEFMLQFNTLQGEDVEFMFVPTTSGDMVAINGIQFVPEPSTALLVGLGLATMATRRRR